MKKARAPKKDDLKPEYDFAAMKGGVRGKYARRAGQLTTVVLIEPELSAAFPSAKAVNEALRSVLTAEKTRARRSSGSRRTASPAR